MGPFRTFQDIPRMTASPSYGIDVSFDDIEDTLGRWGRTVHGGVELEPDFQRGHVWSEAQQVAFVEYALRGGLERAGGQILFNCVGWQDGDREGPMQLVDGLQRLTAIRRFLRDEIPAFGQRCSDYGGHMGHSRRFRFAVNDLPTREAVLRWYIDLNTGGVVHAKEEIDRVLALLEEEIDSQPKGPGL